MRPALRRKDNRTDGYSVAVYWDDLDSARAGKCIDDLGTAKAWTGCNKDLAEGHLIRWRFAWEWTNGWIISENYWETRI
ncbi:hypothetical protein [Glycomyces dulcitolivorans]|uniref:hypothetical protein n=1 Tax=Glycomyces dulcitolivorans TaxID=2200759 RepID=UPI0013004B5E|nr:hypothetical protein [Glycomyces dulcitolivorans]